MAQAVGGRGEQLPALEPFAGLVGRAVSEHPGHEHHQQPADQEPDQRRDDDEDQNLAETAPDDRRQPARLDHRGAHQATDQRVRRRRGDAVVPGDDVPRQRTHQRAEDHDMVHQGRVHRALADGGRHLEFEHPQRGEVEERGEQHRLFRRQRAGGDDGRDGVGSIVEAVHEIESQRDDDQQRQRPERDGEVFHARSCQEFSMRISSIVLAASSQRSSTSSCSE